VDPYTSGGNLEKLKKNNNKNKNKINKGER
jgi:hypothetical protein